MIYELVDEDYLFSNNKKLLQLNNIHSFLSTKSYWAQNITIGTVKQSVKGSLCYGVYYLSEQIAFARVITDKTTFAYLADVFVIENYRGKGISKKFIEFILKDKQLSNIRKFMLATKDAHSLYSKFGFEPIKNPEVYMELKTIESNNS